MIDKNFYVYNASAGSGKTFTLVKEYIKILLRTADAYRFQNILAITFTNKAAAEMKARVLENLKDFSEEKQNGLSKILLQELNLSEAKLFERSKRVLNNILQNYSAFNITTIDSFTHRIIRNFAFDLGLSLNFDVEMDVKLLLEEAVDLLLSKIGLDKDLTEALLAYSFDKADDDKSWDISRDLKDFAKILLNENDINQLKKIEGKTVKQFIALKVKLSKRKNEIEKQANTIGERAINIISENGIEEKDFNRGALPKHFRQLIENISSAVFFDDNTLKKNLEANAYYAKSKPQSVKDAIESVMPRLLELYTESERLYSEYLIVSSVLNGLIPLAVLKHISASLDEIKAQNNIRLNAEFNQLISNEIKNEPAPFIYERLGEKFRYYFIDEMQDTSELQWSNLIPLIENTLSAEAFDGEKGSLMLVGDAKQAIYRWRGGKSEQFIGLSNNDNPFPIEKEVKNLDTNYRSYSEVVNFNNDFFNHIADFFNNSTYKTLYTEGNQQKENNKKGGYVEVSFLEIDKNEEDKKLPFARRVYEIIKEKEENFNLSDICVLVRSKKDGIAIANYLSENGIDIVSSETLLLKNNNVVCLIIDLLQFLYMPENKNATANFLYALSKRLKVTSVHQFLNERVLKSNNEIFNSLEDFGIYFNQDDFFQLPFYEGIEYLIRSFGFLPKSNIFVVALLDVILEFQQKKGFSLHEFLEYWENKKETLSIAIPEGQNAVQIMTIHKSKGLEFPVVIYPFDLEIYGQQNPKIWYESLDDQIYDGFETTLIGYKKKLKHVNAYAEEIYVGRQDELQLDNLNLLYVALTRAAEELFIVVEKKKKIKPLSEATNSSELLYSYLQKNDAESIKKSNSEIFSFGTSIKKTTELEEEKMEIVCQDEFVSSSRKEQNISIVTNASLLWETGQGEAINYGNLIHEILSKIKYEIELTGVVNQYYLEGKINENDLSQVRLLLLAVINNSLLNEYYKPGYDIYNEREILSLEKRVQIPDRVLVKENKVVIIDYKTGEYLKKHEYQINGYGVTFEKMGYDVENKILVYLGDEICIKRVI